MNGTGYDILVFLHVAAVIGLFMGSAILHASATGMAKATKVDAYATWAAAMRRFTPLTGIAALVVFVLGFALLGMNQEKEAFSYSTPWVVISLVLFVLVEGLSGMLLAPYGRNIKAALAAATTAGATDVTPEMRAAVLERKAWFAMFVTTWGFVGVVFLMLVKPEGWLWSSVAAIVAVLIGAVEGHLVYTRLSK
jgi:hypothetical protein